MIALCDCNIWNAWMWTCVFLKYVWWWVVWLPNANVLICDHWCVRLYDRDQTFDRTRHPMGGTGRVSTKVVKITFWLVKSYDFTSQYMFNVLNRLKNLKMVGIRLKLDEIVKIGWNHKKKTRLQTVLTISTKYMNWTKVNVSLLQLSSAYWLLTSWTLRVCLVLR
jgi:hypothetical protein